MRMYKPRGLNVDESYACTRTAVRKCFDGQDVTVLWGKRRRYDFSDSFRRNCPRIEGFVTASMQANHRRYGGEAATLSFYIINNPAYGDAQKKTFETKCLPHLKAWHARQLEAHAQGGVDEILVEWHNGVFRLWEFHYA